MEQGIYAFLLGVTAAIVYTWTESIFSNITLHIVFNLFGSLIVPNIMTTKTVGASVYCACGFIILICVLIVMNKSFLADSNKTLRI